MKENSSKAIRKRVKEMYQIYQSGILGHNFMKENIDDAFIRDLNFLNTNEFLILKEEIFPSDNQYRFTKIVYSMIKMQMYTDYYRLEKYNKLTQDNTTKIYSYEEFMNLVNKDKNSSYLVKSIKEFDSLPAYTKVLYTKCLTEKENEYLENKNPFYKEERTKYDININIDFIIRQINQWMKNFPFETAVEVTVNFLLNLKKIDMDEYVKVIHEICEYLDYNDEINLTILVKDCYNKKNKNIKKLRYTKDEQ